VDFHYFTVAPCEIGVILTVGRLITSEDDDMSFEDRLRAKCTVNLRRDIEETLCVAMSETGFLALREDIERRHSEAACLHEIAVDNLRATESDLNEIQPVMDLVYAIGCMRDVAAEFGKTPKNVENDMFDILETARRPLSSDSCVDRLFSILEADETPEERAVREERDYQVATGGSHFNDPIAKAERAIGALTPPPRRRRSRRRLQGVPP
jgi:hypothetical protein